MIGNISGAIAPGVVTADLPDGSAVGRMAAQLKDLAPAAADTVARVRMPTVLVPR